MTDPTQMIASGLTTCPTHQVMDFLTNYVKTEKVEAIVVGYPKTMNNQPSETVAEINPFIKKLVKQFPDLKVYQEDERLTSRMAMQTLIDAGAKKKDRRRKELVDTISASLILQSFLERRKNQKSL